MSAKFVLLAACAALAAAMPTDLTGDIGSGESGSGSGSGSGSPPPPLDTQVSFTMDSAKDVSFFDATKQATMIAGMATTLSVDASQVLLTVAPAPPPSPPPGRRLSETTGTTLSWGITTSENDVVAMVETIVTTTNQQWNQAFGGGTQIDNVSTPTVAKLGGGSNNLALGLGVGLGVGIPVLLVGGYVFMKKKQGFSGPENGALQIR